MKFLGLTKSTLLAATLLAASGCKKEAATTAAPGSGSAVAGSAAATNTGSGSAAVANTASGSAAQDEAAKAAESLAKAKAKLAEDLAAEKARWTPELDAALVALAERDIKDTATALEAILASNHRQPGDSERDKYRHPTETLTFFGVTPASSVVEFGGGGGWYTELLAPLLAKNGSFTVTGADPDGPADKSTTVYGQRLVGFLAKSPGGFGKVERVVYDPAKPSLGADGSKDVVLAIRELHNWVRRGELDTNLKAAWSVLKDGGTLGIVAHRAKPETTPETTDVSGETGYLPEAWLIEKVTAAGFKLAEKSDINANPADTSDYPKGVWNLPPGFRDGDTDRAKYAAIGESDRMTLRFTKVAAPATK